MAGHGRRGKHGGAHENHERWLLTYADMITLLVAFFIMLYAMSVTNSAKFNTLAISVRSGFGNPMPEKPSILDGSGVGAPHDSIKPSVPKKSSLSLGLSRDGTNKTAHDVAKSEKVVQQLKQILSKGHVADHVKVSSEERGVVVTVLADKYTFDSGSAALKPDMKPILDQIASVIKEEPNSVRVEGHTDDLPIDNDRFPSNWQLSAVRAANVLCYFVSSGGIDPDRIGCVGYADQRPLVANTSEQNRAKNRRVEIVILNNTEPTPAVSAPAESDSSRESNGLIMKPWKI